ncbi:hypothetical protein R4P64_32095 [Rhodococcus sp. IEGM 1366]|uniref:hypothetical protein n=1 Tax=Rhodococcus sp. IEGM 1366 TaxID=3082223 RepID=UPI0029552C08|nr:hypothetical protein [Rhodococcus sp. IEGM 1366]MDV8071161.1 hypothetical protein [Rhodococcus sp. IEGM 1366]
MVYSIATSPETKVQLAAHADVPKFCREQVHRIVDDHQWKPLPGSRGASDLTPDPAFPTPPTISVNEVAAIYLDMAGHHLAALSALYESHEVLMSVDMLTRAIVECCASAVCIQEGATPHERLARAYLEEDFSNEEQKKVAGRLTRPNSLYSMAAKDRFKRIRKEIAANFPGDYNLNDRVIHGQNRAGPTDAVSRFFALMESSGAVGFTGRKRKEGYYDLLSNGTHPTLYRMRDLRRYQEVGTDQIRRTTLIMDPGFLASLVQLAVLAIYNGPTSIYSYNGWSFDLGGEFESKINQVLPGLLR